MDMYEDGVEIMVLPDTAHCTVTNEYPLHMSECPLGYETCTGWCENYSEEPYCKDDDI